MAQTETAHETTSEATTRSVGVLRLVMRCRELEIDHNPDGWPAIQMRDVSALCDALDVPRWADGEPANIRADVADALEWLKTISPQGADNHRRLERCMANMTQWVVDA